MCQHKCDPHLRHSYQQNNPCATCPHAHYIVVSHILRPTMSHRVSSERTAAEPRHIIGGSCFLATGRLCHAWPILLSRVGQAMGRSCHCIVAIVIAFLKHAQRNLPSLVNHEDSRRSCRCIVRTRLPSEVPSVGPGDVAGVFRTCQQSSRRLCWGRGQLTRPWRYEQQTSCDTCRHR
jgi:hypothetical protein